MVNIPKCVLLKNAFARQLQTDSTYIVGPAGHVSSCCCEGQIVNLLCYDSLRAQGLQEAHVCRDVDWPFSLVN